MEPDFKVDPSLRPAAALGSSHLPSDAVLHRPQQPLVVFSSLFTQITSGFSLAAGLRSPNAAFEFSRLLICPRQRAALCTPACQMFPGGQLARRGPAANADRILAEGKRFLSLDGPAEGSVAVWPSLQAPKVTRPYLRKLPGSQVSSSNCSFVLPTHRNQTSPIIICES